MARKKRARRKQGLVSWVTSILALGIGLSGVAVTFKAGGLAGLASRASFSLTAGGPFNMNEGLVIYAPMIAGIVFKKLADELVKAARIQTLVPRLG